MNDKTPMYILIIVGIVAVVGIVAMLTSASNPESAIPAGNGNTLTGNVALESSYVPPGSIGKILMTLVLLGVAGYMYYKGE
jgi:hypothetical protein